MIGLFAIPQILQGIVMKSNVIPEFEGSVSGVFTRIKDVMKFTKVKIISSLIGTGVGAIPGAGGPIAVFLAYDVQNKMRGRGKEAEDDAERNSLEGVAAPEAANNAMCGGAMIPMLTLGIPGDPITAILLGALMIQGLTPGPLLFQSNPRFVYAVFWAFLVAVIMVLFVTLSSMKVWIRVLRVPRWILLPTISVFCVVGTYSLQNSFWDTGIMLFFGLLGFLMRRYGFPVVPLLLALVLGGAFERHVRTALVTSQGNPLVFITKPISAVFIAIALISFFVPIIRQFIRTIRSSREGCADD
jgi:putative tricarboxylic transport membrane protein